jgi:pyruvate kinase
MGAPESLASAAVKTAYDMNASLIIVVTESGNTARLVSKYFPSIPVAAITRNGWVARQCSGYLANIRSRLLSSVESTEEILHSTIEEYVASGQCKRGDAVVCVFGSRVGTPDSTNIMRVFTA